MDVFNLGTGTPYSVLKIVDSFERSNSVPVMYEFDLPEFWASADKARDILGRTASRSLDEMCHDTWNWQKQNPQGYHS